MFVTGYFLKNNDAEYDVCVFVAGDVFFLLRCAKLVVVDLVKLSKWYVYSLLARVKGI